MRKQTLLWLTWKSKTFIHEKGACNRPLSERHKGMNRLTSQIRRKIEPIYEFTENSMGGPEQEYIGLNRNSAGIGLSNLACNLLRYIQLINLGRIPAMAKCD